MEKKDLIKSLSKEINIKENQIEAVLNLLEEGATVPFIARYRKEATGGLDENEIRTINEGYTYQVNLTKRKEDVIRLIDEKGMLTPDLEKKILLCEKLVDVEDLYLPYKEKKKTKATLPRKYGLEGLAKIMLSNINKSKEEVVTPFLNNDVKTISEAIEGAKYIIAEDISDDAYFRKIIRHNLERVSYISTKIKKDAVDPKEVFKNYYEYTESTRTIKDHRILAINRGEKLEVLSVSMSGDEESNVEFLKTKLVHNEIFEDDIIDAIKDSYKRLIFPSISREIRSNLTDRAENNAIEIFSLNLKALLMTPPLKNKVVLGVDPAFRTGCKLAVVDQTGKLLEIAVIKPTEEYPGSGVKEKDLLASEKTIVDMCNKYNVDIITIGNGTASRETESFIANTISKFNLKAKYVIVSEAGASVYSASEIAQKEFPDLSLEKRSAVSIARRIQDPLAELVKIEPKAIGVGQYQHDVNPKKLEEKLQYVVEDAVNSVGVDLNTASIELLTYISGLNKKSASSIVEHRNKNGKFLNRNDVLKVAGLGPKTYEQCIGFLRIYDGTQILDSTSIHPESYKVTLDILKYLNIDPSSLGHINLDLSKINKDELINKFKIDKYTLDDILESIVKPMRDIRDDFTAPVLKSSQTKLTDLKIGDSLEGTVRNVVDFGVFVDCGLHEDGLVHVSKMSKNYIKHPSDLVKVGDIITVYVIGIDEKKGKLALSMIKE